MKTGLVLTGGSLRGIVAEIAALSVLLEKGFRPDAVIGTSAGSVVASMYGAGMDGPEMEHTISSIRYYDYIDPDFKSLILAPFRRFKGWSGLLKGRQFHKWIEKNIPVKYVEDFRVPTHICVTNVSRGRPECLNMGRVADLVRASTAIPFVYQPQKIGNDYYVDGGAVNNVALDEMVERHPDMDRYLILTALRVFSPEAPSDNSFLKQRWTPVKLLQRIIDAISEELKSENTEVFNNKPFTIMRPKAELHLDEPHRIKEAMKVAKADARAIIEASDFKL